MGVLYSPRIPQASNILLALDPSSSKGITNPNTNLYSLPENFSGATTFVGPGTPGLWYTFQSSVRANAGLAPDGTSTATLLTDSIDASSSTHSVRQVYSHSAGETLTVSIFAKANTCPTITLVVSIVNFDDGIERGVNFNLKTGQTSYTTAATPGFSMTDVGNGWWRCSMTYTATLAAVNGVQIRTHNGTSSFYTGNGSGSIFIWGAMLNPGSTLQDYAPQNAISNFNKLNLYTSSDLIVNNNSFTSASSPRGQAEFTSPGTYLWTCPSGVTSVSAVCVGGGAGGLNGSGIGNPGGDSYFISTTTVKGGGASLSSGSNTYGTSSYIGDGGGAGGRPYPLGAYSIGGGGAGGYTGAGGTGVTYSVTNGTAGQGGGGGGGGGNLQNDGAGGGGVGIYGQGVSGALGSGANGGGGGSGGTSGTSVTGSGGGNGGLYGGGGGSATGYWNAGSGGALGWKNNISVIPGQNYSVVVGAGGLGQGNAGKGGNGAVRIIWGDGRSFPNNATDVTSSGSQGLPESSSSISTLQSSVSLNSVTYNSGYLIFSGASSSYATISNVPTTEYITVSAAVFLSNWTTATGTFISNADTDGTTRYQLGINNSSYSGNVGAIFKTRLGNLVVSFSRAGIAAGWHILTAVFDGSSAILYIDGSLVATTTSASATVLESLSYNNLTLAAKLTGSTPSENIACRIGVLTIANQAYTSNDANSYYVTYRGKYGV